MTDFEDDFASDFPTPNENPNAVQRLKKSAAEVVQLEATVEALEEQAKQVRKQALHLRSKVMPELMAELGLLEFKADTGHEFTVADIISGALPKDPVGRAAAISLLESYGAADLIKTDLTLEFGRKEYQEAQDLANKLHLDGYDVEMETGVHAQTLSAFARERLRKGEDIDFDKLGLSLLRQVKVKEPKEKP